MKPPASFRAFVFACLVSVALPTVSNAASVIFQDATFLDADWTTTLQTTGAGGTGSTAQMGSGGNPGAYSQITIALNSSTGPDAAVWVFDRKTGATYTPSVSGAILSIKYSESSIQTSVVQACGLAIRQGGVIYYGTKFFNTTSWATTTQLALTAANFDALPAGIQNPNFSGTGGTIEFGYFRGNSTGAFGPGYTTIGGIDNWYVEVVNDAPVATQQSTWGNVKALYR